MFSITQTPLKIDGNRCILALGTDTRPGLCWIDKKTLFHLSPRREVDDMDDFYRQAAVLVVRRYRVRPSVVAFDPHPHFACQRLASSLKEKFFPSARLAAVYHHWAHVANFVIDIARPLPFIGVAFDGTGFGADGRVWGGEFFSCTRRGFKRLAHLKYQPLAGNEAAIREPWRLAFGILKTASCGRGHRPRAAFLEHIPKEKLRIVDRMIDQGFQTPMTSSAGRLFDAAAALLGLVRFSSKQAEAAQSVEKAAFSCRLDVPGYPVRLVTEASGCLVLDTGDLFCRMRQDLARHAAPGVIARKFHYAVAGGIFEVCRRLAERCGTLRVYVSGGVFMNRILRERMRELFAKSRLRLMIPAPEHMTDDAIARGQIGYCLMRQSGV